MDKKIKELMKVCNSYELLSPSNKQIESLINKVIPSIESNIKQNLLNYIH